MKLNLENYEMMVDDNVKVKGPFIHRDITLLDFNKRVLKQTKMKKYPMNERMKFLAITGSNMDEFISVRFAGICEAKETEPYDEVLSKMKKFKKKQDKAFIELKEKLERKYGLEFTKPKNLGKKELEKLRKEYISNIFPLLTPFNVDGLEIPNIVSGEVCIIVIINDNGVERSSILPIPKNIDLIIQIGNKVLYTEDVIRYFMKNTIFMNRKIVGSGAFRVIRDASVILSHDKSRFIVDRMSETLRRRKNGNPIFLELTKNVNAKICSTLMGIFKIPNGHVYRKGEVLSYKRFMQPLLSDDYSFKPFKVIHYENQDNYFSIFDALKNNDILLHHPYESYDTVVQFIEHASKDKDVIGIKQTLYRVSGLDSPIVNALCAASRNGKRVDVMVEIKARFDEDNNIRLVDKLKEAGVHVIFGDEYLKTHCKMCVVLRKESDDIRIYSHIATGNYNEKTAKLYTDISYLTSKQKIGSDLITIFNILTDACRPIDELQKVRYSPVNLRKTLIDCIDREIKIAKKGKEAEIFMKVNSLSDTIMANKIYEAADKGVKINIICRGVCSIQARKNLNIKSIVGRFLEHSRIYYFRNDGNSDYFISSADLLTRNLDKRVELMINLKDSEVVGQLDWMISVFNADKGNSFVMTENGKWKKPECGVSCQDMFISSTYDRKVIKKIKEQEKKEKAKEKEQKTKKKDKKKKDKKKKKDDK